MNNPKETKKTAIFARSATNESSLEIQVETCKKYAAEHGYAVVNILRTVCSGLDLLDNPHYKELWKLITDQTINAVVVADRDRLMTDPKQRVQFILDCREFNIEILIADGSPSISQVWDNLTKLVKSRSDFAKKTIKTMLNQATEERLK